MWESYRHTKRDCYYLPDDFPVSGSVQWSSSTSMKPPAKNGLHQMQIAMQQRLNFPYARHLLVLILRKKTVTSDAAAKIVQLPQDLIVLIAGHLSDPEPMHVGQQYAKLIFNKSDKMLRAIRLRAGE